jgi:hypothetical protein
VLLAVGENNIGIGGKHQKQEVRIKTQKQSYEVLVYKERDLCESYHYTCPPLVI